MELDVQQIQAFIESNKDNEDVKSFLGKLSTPTPDAVKGFLETSEEGQKLFQSLTDSRVSKAIETWKTNNLSKIIEEEIAKRNPQETPEQKELRELRAMFEQERQQRARAELLAKAQAKATSEGLPVDLVEFFLADSEEATYTNLAKLKGAVDAIVKAEVEKTFKGNGREPHINGNGNAYSGPNPYKRETFNLTLQAKLEAENPELAAALQRAASGK